MGPDLIMTCPDLLIMTCPDLLIMTCPDLPTMTCSDLIMSRPPGPLTGVSTTRFWHWKISSRKVFRVKFLEEGIKKYISSWKKKLEESILGQKLEEKWKKIYFSKLLQIYSPAPAQLKQTGIISVK